MSLSSFILTPLSSRSTILSWSACMPFINWSMTSIVPSSLWDPPGLEPLRDPCRPAGPSSWKPSSSSDWACWSADASSGVNRLNLSACWSLDPSSSVTKPCWASAPSSSQWRSCWTLVPTSLLQEPCWALAPFSLKDPPTDSRPSGVANLEESLVSWSFSNSSLSRWFSAWEARSCKSIDSILLSILACQTIWFCWRPRISLSPWSIAIGCNSSRRWTSSGLDGTTGTSWPPEPLGREGRSNCPPGWTWFPPPGGNTEAEAIASACCSRTGRSSGEAFRRRSMLWICSGVNKGRTGSASRAGPTAISGTGGVNATGLPTGWLGTPPDWRFFLTLAISNPVTFVFEPVSESFTTDVCPWMDGVWNPSRCDSAGVPLAGVCWFPTLWPVSCWPCQRKFLAHQRKAHILNRHSSISASSTHSSAIRAPLQRPPPMHDHGFSWLLVKCICWFWAHNLCFRMCPERKDNRSWSTLEPLSNTEPPFTWSLWYTSRFCALMHPPTPLCCFSFCSIRR